MFLDLLLAGASAVIGIGDNPVQESIFTILREEASIINNHIYDFASAMRLSFPTADSFYPSFIERESFLSDDYGKEVFAYLDFEGNNGFAIIAQNMEMPWFEPNGQVAFFSSEQIFFNRELGLVTNSNKGNAVSIGDINAKDETKTGNYVGQEANAVESGKIINPQKYIVDRYGKGWSLVGNYTPSWTSFNRQDEFSIYSRLNDDGTISYEGNCLLSSIYLTLDYWRSSGSIPSLPSGLVPTSPQNDVFYYSLMSQKTSFGKPRYSVHKNLVPSIYKITRDWFRDHDSYLFDSATASKTPDFISYFDGLYGLSITSRYMTSWDFDNDILSSISFAYRMYIWNQDYGDYPRHSMSVCGIYQAKKTSGWWIFSHTDYVNLIRVNDNYAGSERFIDFTAYQKEHPNSGSFVEIKLK